MAYSIFYSWQSDLPNNKNRSFIENCIKQAIKKNKDIYDISVFFDYDRDTLNVTGSPDIVGTIFSKIEQSDLFISDISIINSQSDNRKTPNPNVLIELGYAASVLGWERIICVYNTDYGSFDDLPFDLRQKRILRYNKDDSKQKLSNIFADIFNQLYGKGLLFHPIKDHIKGKIDYCLLEIVKHFSCILYGTMTMSEALSKVTDCLDLEIDMVVELLKESKFLGFFAYNNLNEIKRKLETLLDITLVSKHTKDFWASSIIDMLDWLRYFQYLLSGRKGNLYSSICQPSPAYKVISAHEMNGDNPIDSYILLKTIGKDEGKVLYTASLPMVQNTQLLSPYHLNEDMIEEYSKCLYRAILIVKKWLKSTGSEIILDPEYYYLL